MVISHFDTCHQVICTRGEQLKARTEGHLTLHVSIRSRIHSYKKYFSFLFRGWVGNVRQCCQQQSTFSLFVLASPVNTTLLKTKAVLPRYNDSHYKYETAVRDRLIFTIPVLEKTPISTHTPTRVNDSWIRCFLPECLEYYEHITYQFVSHAVGLRWVCCCCFCCGWCRCCWC